MKIKNALELTIRMATPSDAPKMISYLNQIGGESDNLTFGKNEFRFNEKQESEFIENINQTKVSRLFLGIIDDEIISMGNIICESKPRLAHNATIGITVKKKYWNHGVGKQMMETMINHARNTKLIKNIKLEVRSDNVVAISLYTKLGFVQTGIIKNELMVNGEYFDNLIMIYYI